MLLCLPYTNDSEDQTC